MLGFVSGIALLHVIGWGGALLFGSLGYSFLIGLAGLAYVLGLRHGFDADHIAAVDGTTRKLIQEQRSPHGVGFYFSLGHSTIVFAMALAIVLGAHAMGNDLPRVHALGGHIAVIISSAFLYLVALVNVAVFRQTLRVRRSGLRGDDDDVVGGREREVRRGGPLTWVLGRVLRLVGRSWHMYVVGLLFGLGFDTASEIALLAIAALAAAQQLPIAAVLTLPVVFAAGMSLVDTTDGALMARAYGWAAADPARRVTYNLVVTGITVVIAVLIGSAQLLALAAEAAPAHVGIGAVLEGVNTQLLGVGIVVLFVITWAVALLRARRGSREPCPEAAADDP